MFRVWGLGLAGASATATCHKPDASEDANLAAYVDCGEIDPSFVRFGGAPPCGFGALLHEALGSCLSLQLGCMSVERLQHLERTSSGGGVMRQGLGNQNQGHACVSLGM